MGKGGAGGRWGREVGMGGGEGRWVRSLARYFDFIPCEKTKRLAASCGTAEPAARGRNAERTLLMMAAEQPKPVRRWHRFLPLSITLAASAPGQHPPSNPPSVSLGACGTLRVRCSPRPSHPGRPWGRGASLPRAGGEPARAERIHRAYRAEHVGGSAPGLPESPRLDPVQPCVHRYCFTNPGILHTGTDGSIL